MLDILKHNIQESICKTIGKPKQPNYALPPINHVYGYKKESNNENVSLSNYNIYIYIFNIIRNSKIECL